MLASTKATGTLRRRITLLGEPDFIGEIRKSSSYTLSMLEF